MTIELIETLSPDPAPGVLVSDLIAKSNHRIANSLSLIAGLMHLRAANLSKHSPTMSTEDVRSILKEFGTRIETVGHLHRLLAQGNHERTVNLATYLRDVSAAVVSSLSNAGNTDLRFVADCDCSIPTQKALTLGLIVSEVVTNGVKYAHPTKVPGRITVECRRRRSDVVVKISDDGVGLPEGFDPMHSENLGLRLVRSLADQLDAKIEFISTPLGLSVVLQMPD